MRLLVWQIVYVAVDLWAHATTAEWRSGAHAQPLRRGEKKNNRTVARSFANCQTRPVAAYYSSVELSARRRGPPNGPERPRTAAEVTRARRRGRATTRLGGARRRSAALGGPRRPSGAVRRSFGGAAHSRKVRR